MAGANELFDAIKAGRLSVVTALLDADPALVSATIDAEEAGMTPLHAAVVAGQLQVVRLLLARGADASARNGGGRMPLHDAFEYGRDLIAQLLISEDTGIDACAAAAFGRLNELKSRLAANPAEANDLTTGLTPMGWAAYGQQAEAAKMLLAAGAKVTGDPYDELFWGPAADVAAIHVAHAALQAGADPNWRDPEGNTPAHLVVLSPMVADPSYFIELLRHARADVTIKNAAGHTALDEAKAQSANPQKNLARAIAVLSA